MNDTQMNEQLPDLLVDSREPIEIQEAVKAVFKGKIVSVETLPTDYIIPPSDKVPGWAIERKQAGDFVHTWFGDRLGDQLSMLKALAESGEYRAALMIVGNPTVTRRKKGEKGGVNPIAIQNMITSVASQWGITVLPVYSEWQMPLTLKYLVSKMDGKKAFVNPRSGASREDSPKDQAIYVAAGFPGCGPKTLERIRAETPSLIDFIDRVHEDWDGQMEHKVECLTDKQKEKINAVLNAEWSTESK